MAFYSLNNRFRQSMERRLTPLIRVVKEIPSVAGMTARPSIKLVKEIPSVATLLRNDDAQLVEEGRRRRVPTFMNRCGAAAKVQIKKNVAYLIFC